MCLGPQAEPQAEAQADLIPLGKVVDLVIDNGVPADLAPAWDAVVGTGVLTGVLARQWLGFPEERKREKLVAAEDLRSDSELQGHIDTVVRLVMEKELQLREMSKPTISSWVSPQEPRIMGSGRERGASNILSLLKFAAMQLLLTYYTRTVTTWAQMLIPGGILKCLLCTHTYTLNLNVTHFEAGPGAMSESPAPALRLRKTPVRLPIEISRESPVEDQVARQVPVEVTSTPGCDTEAVVRRVKALMRQHPRDLRSGRLKDKFTNRFGLYQ